MTEGQHPTPNPGKPNANRKEVNKKKNMIYILNCWKPYGQVNYDYILI